METQETNEKTDKAKAKQARHWAKAFRQVGPMVVMAMPCRTALQFCVGCVGLVKSDDGYFLSCSYRHVFVTCVGV